MAEFVQELKFSDLYGYKGIPSSLEICISEFIDNSINSFENYNKKRWSNDTLEIKIKYFQNKKESFYEIEDNANGISDLNSAMKTYGRLDEKILTTKSNYGQGMKFGIFWIGKEGIIYTKCNGQKEQKGEFVSGEDNQVINKISDSENNEINNESGTKIKIKGIWNEGGCLTPKKMDDLINFLGLRYDSYLNNNQKFPVVIRIITYEKSKDNNDWEVKESNVVKPYDIFKEFEKLKISNFINNGSISENQIKEIQKNIDNNNYSSLSCEFLRKFINNEEMIFDKLEIPIAINGTKELIKCKLMVLAKPDVKKSGILIRQSNRYIMHPTFWKDMSGEGFFGTYQWYGSRAKENRFLGGIYKWVTAEINLEDIPNNKNCEIIKPNKNKTGLVFEDDFNNKYRITNDQFDNCFRNYISELEDFLREIIKLSNKANRNAEFEINKNSGGIAGHDSSFDEDIIKIEPNENLKEELKRKFKLNIKKLDINTIDIEFDKNLDKDELICIKERDKDKGYYKYSFNSECKYINNSDIKNNISILWNFAVLICYVDIIIEALKDNKSNITSIDTIIRLLFEAMNKN